MVQRGRGSEVKCACSQEVNAQSEGIGLAYPFLFVGSAIELQEQLDRMNRIDRLLVRKKNSAEWGKATVEVGGALRSRA